MPRPPMSVRPCPAPPGTCAAWMHGQPCAVGGRDRWVANVSWDEAARPLSPALLLWSLMFPEMACFTVSEIQRCLLTFACLSLCPPSVTGTGLCLLGSPRDLPPQLSLAFCFLWKGGGKWAGFTEESGFRGWVISDRWIDEEEEKRCSCWRGWGEAGGAFNKSKGYAHRCCLYCSCVSTSSMTCDDVTGLRTGWCRLGLFNIYSSVYLDYVCINKPRLL